MTDKCPRCNRLPMAALSCTDARHTILVVSRADPDPAKWEFAVPAQYGPEDAQTRCLSCNVIAGGYHHAGCKFEMCPIHHGFISVCGCLRTDAPELKGAIEVSRKPVSDPGEGGE